MREREGRPPRSVLAAGALLAVATVVSLLPERGGAGSPSSSYGTGPTGSGAYAELLGRFDHRVERIRGKLDRADLAAGSTLVILDAGLDDAEVERVARFVRAGGRLVAGGARAGLWLEEVVPGVPAMTPAPALVATATGGAPESEGIGEVRLAGFGTLAGPGELEPLLVGREDGAPVAVVGDVGAGRVVVLADATPLQNILLGVADNAAFGLALAGPAGTPVVFAEGPHGYGTATGLAALPVRWRVALGGLALAAAVWLVARSRRLGPPEDEFRDLGPRRRDYVDALAGTLG
ncbi:MAG: DUF4350 domain-containing protein, partial [Acidimicrobiia bacterium]